jgi:hypothetical protein
MMAGAAAAAGSSASTTPPFGQIVGFSRGTSDETPLACRNNLGGCYIWVYPTVDGVVRDGFVPLDAGDAVVPPMRLGGAVEFIVESTRTRRSDEQRNQQETDEVGRHDVDAGGEAMLCYVSFFTPEAVAAGYRDRSSGGSLSPIRCITLRFRHPPTVDAPLYPAVTVFGSGMVTSLAAL